MGSSRYPRKIADIVPWLSDHATVWKAAPTGVGLSILQANAIDAAAKALAQSFADANKARQAAQNATEVQTSALRTALTLLQQDLRIIDAFAANAASPAAVYTAAQINPPAAPATVPPPGAVTGITVGIDIVSGATVLRWKSNNPAGSTNVSYIVKRRLPGAAGFTFVGVGPGSGPEARMFKDETLPQGVDSVDYTVMPQRGSVPGPATQVSVRFGVVGGGAGGAPAGVSFSISDASGKIAA